MLQRVSVFVPFWLSPVPRRGRATCVRSSGDGPLRAVSINTDDAVNSTLIHLALSFVAQMAKIIIINFIFPKTCEHVS